MDDRRRRRIAAVHEERLMRSIEDLRAKLAEKRIEVAILVRALEDTFSAEVGLRDASLYHRLGGDPDPKGCAACRGTGLRAGPYA
jgi:hypothetical protein